MARLFVAVWPPAPVLEQLEALTRPVIPGVRYTRRDQWHVTLRFLGEVEVGDVAAALEEFHAPAATAELGPAVRTLGRHVLCVPVSGLDELASAVVTATADIGEPPGPRPFCGHVTLARLGRRAPHEIGGERIAARFLVSEIHLVESLRSDGRVIYATRLTISLE
ncbi:MAG: RNA 2',3'-cyclic phosphodiesterase [Acidimicrobiales bacterium]|nr:RNA 2',3'-cyclic phosphodiesterase [Acidimicrobiales bacterium]